MDILSSAGRERLRSAGAGGYFLCNAVKVLEEKGVRPFDKLTSLTSLLISSPMNLILTCLRKASFWLEDRLGTWDDSYEESSSKPVHALYSSTCFILF